MHRYGVIVDKLFKGVPPVVHKTTPKFSGVNDEPELIYEWSPNNIRRIVFGLPYVYIQYFVTSKKVPRLYDRIDVRKAISEDLVLLSTDPAKYKSVLASLVDVRVLSCVEEIYFLVNDYPERVLRADLNFSVLESGNVRLASRFPRLRHISKIRMNEQTLMYLLNQSRGKGNLLLDVLKSSPDSDKFALEVLLEPHVDDWWSGSLLRPNYYHMDGTVLAEYFDAVRQMKEKEVKSDKAYQAQLSRYTEALEKREARLKDALTCFFSLVNSSHQVFKDSSLVSKSEWSNVLQDKSQYRAFKHVLKHGLGGSNETDLVTVARSIDYDKLVSLIPQLGGTSELAQLVLDFRNLLFDSVLVGEEEYKRDSNKLDFVVSLDSLENLVVTLLRTEVNIVYLALVQYLSRNTPKYASFFYDMIRSHLPSVVYTRSIIRFCNTFYEDGVAKQVFDDISAVEVLEEQFKLGSRYREATKVLQALATVAKT